MQSNFQSALIVGGTRGIGRELALILDDKGVETHVVARETQNTFKTNGSRIRTLSIDASALGKAEKLLGTVQPDLIVLTAGATPKMMPFHQMSWGEFSSVWETDVKIAHNFLSAALSLPMKRGGTVISFSSGAGLSGSRLSGGYAGAKRMQHFLTDYAQQEADKGDLGLRFVSVIPKQLVEGTEKGQAAAAAYAATSGVALDQLWAQWDAPLTAAGVANHVADIVFQPEKWSGHAYTVMGSGLCDVS